MTKLGGDEISCKISASGAYSVCVILPSIYPEKKVSNQICKKLKIIHTDNHHSKTPFMKIPTIPPFSRVICLLACTLLTSCSDLDQLDEDLVAVNTAQEATKDKQIETQQKFVESARKLEEAKRGRREDQRDEASAALKTERLQQRVTYLQTCIKSANEQCDALNQDLTKYKMHYIK
jgi:hypothetical protein